MTCTRTERSCALRAFVGVNSPASLPSPGPEGKNAFRNSDSKLNSKMAGKAAAQQSSTNVEMGAPPSLPLACRAAPPPPPPPPPPPLLVLLLLLLLLFFTLPPVRFSPR
jgi:MYXO-CTERM domain-containing protein